MSEAPSIRDGDALPPAQVTPDLGRVIRYCGLIWNFPPFFYDVEAARAGGMPGTLVPGPLKLGFLAHYVEDWLGGWGFVRHVRAAHRRPDITNRPLTLAGEVARVYEEDGAVRVDLELAVVNGDGQPSCRGFATVQLYPKG
ncbi:MAG: MaoC family dehydratase [Dehalococcoidia bacterium]